MREGKIRRRAIGQHHLMDEGGQIDNVVVEAAHIAAKRIGQRAFGQALPAPIERGNREAARAQIADGLKILLNKFGAPLASLRRCPAGIPQRDPVKRLQSSRDDVVGCWIGGNGDERHGPATKAKRGGTSAL